ncbi:MAG: putative 2-phosphosulfolactate phosphatase [Verrucomicrobia subdivision 3 bacterium]|nr:putative 2-phosphosulfolactate phosphatase [Limisphaerales bacterium]MCS1416649.1 putative 2-phosphosulfolactate phosphatase [Limisphaerales bacterium]
MFVRTLLSPHEIEAVSTTDLSQAHSVVSDVLQATSTIVTAFANEASEILSASTIHEAVVRHQQIPEGLLAGKRNGLPITHRTLGIHYLRFRKFAERMRFTTWRQASNFMTKTNGTKTLFAAKSPASGCRCVASQPRRNHPKHRRSSASNRPHLLQ